MRLATIKDGASRDGRLVVVSQDGTRVAPVKNYLTLQSALDDWERAQQYFTQNSDELEGASCQFLAPLPRAYAFLDGSAFIQHVILARKARGAEPPEDLMTVPLMYQGMSDTFLSPSDDILLLDKAHGLDFEGEIAVILSDVPMGTKASEALRYVKLIVLLNDISLRNLIPGEMKTGFGFLQSKPPSTLGSYAVTPDELGSAWKEGRVHLKITCTLNGTTIGTPDAGEMHFSFADLIAHAARTRPLAAGTIIGSGTISNVDERAGVACLVERRMREQIAMGEPKTPFLNVGDRIEIEMLQGEQSVFGKISQRVISRVDKA